MTSYPPSQRFNRSSLPSVWQAMGATPPDGADVVPEMELEWVLDGYAWPHVTPLMPPGEARRTGDKSDE